MISCDASLRPCVCLGYLHNGTDIYISSLMAIRRCSSRLRTAGSTVEPLFSSSSCLSKKFPLTSPKLEHPLCQPQILVFIPHHITSHLIFLSIHLFKYSLPKMGNIGNFPWQGIMSYFSHWATGRRVSDGLEVACGKKSSADISRVGIGFWRTAGNLTITGS